MIRIKLKKNTAVKVRKRIKNKARIRKKLSGTSERPRLTVFKSARHIYLQLIDDSNGRTLMAVNSMKAEKGSKKKTEVAKAAGIELGKMAVAKNIKQIVFDRSGYVYHGRIKAAADGVREAGLSF